MWRIFLRVFGRRLIKLKGMFKSRLGHTPLALVTGGSSGMGLEYCRALAGAGCDLLIVSIEKEKLPLVSAQIASEFGVKAEGIYMDLARVDAADELYSYCHKQGFEVDILINDAGVFFFKELGLENIGKMEMMLLLHNLTPAKLCILFGEDMKKRGCGYILNMSSVSASLPFPGITTYAATKAFLKSFGKALYYEMKPYGVRVCTMCPGAVATPLYKLKPSLMKIGVGIGIIKRPSTIVRRGLRGMYRGRRVVNPSLMSYYLPPLFSILPKPVISAIWKRL